MGDSGKSHKYSRNSKVFTILVISTESLYYLKRIGNTFQLINFLSRTPVVWRACNSFVHVKLIMSFPVFKKTIDRRQI